MKLNSSALCVALFNGSMLLSLTPACLKSAKPPPSTTSSPSTRPSPTSMPETSISTPTPRLPSPTPASQTAESSLSESQVVPSLRGTYDLVDSAAASQTVSQAIEAAVKGMFLLLRGPAEKELKKKNLPPPPQIIISYTEASVTIKTELGTIQTPAAGTFVDRTILGEKLKVSTKWKQEKLERIFKGGDGQRVNTYSLSRDGKTLTMHVIVTSKWLPRPLTYALNYRRK